MKKVFSNYREVMHVYAQRTQQEGRSSNVYFESDRIYSYGRHYLLAEFLDHNTIMINDSGYSVTTSKHISHITAATRQYKQYFTTQTDINLVDRKIADLKYKLSKAKKPELYANDILSLCSKLFEYIEERKPIYFDDANNKLSAIKAIYDELSNQDSDYIKRLHADLLERNRREKIQKAKNLEINLSKFFSYEIDSFTGDEDYLRISQDGLFIETSQRVKIGIGEAKILYLMIKAGKDIIGHKIDNYTVLAINGTLKIGCHHINMVNVHEIGNKIINL